MAGMIMAAMQCGKNHCTGDRLCAGIGLCNLRHVDGEIAK